MPHFTSNFPYPGDDYPKLLSLMERTGAPPALTGRGVVMAFIDAGFYPHPDLADRILLHVDASTNHVVEQRGRFKVSDLSWHGQMTSVIAAGDGRTSGGRYRGLASGASLVLIKVSTPRGQIKETDIVRGLRWLLDTHRRLNVRIVNISVGGDFVSVDPEHPLHRAVRKLVEAGVTVVIAAGNRPVDHLLPPASAPEAITVGGVNDHNALDSSLWTLYHHSYGRVYDGSRKPDILAPAVWIPSPILPGSHIEREVRWLAPLLRTSDEARIHHLLRQGYRDLGLMYDAALNADETVYMTLQQRIHAHKVVDAHHQHVDGTSVAAPIVSAAAALLLEVNPCLTPMMIRAMLTHTARLLPDVPLERQGAGVLDVRAAVRLAKDSV
jgi:serine protease AprX